MEIDSEDSSDSDFQISSSHSSSSEGNENAYKISSGSSSSTDSDDDEDQNYRSFLGVPAVESRRITSVPKHGSVLITSILSGDTDGVKSLIESGIDVNIPTEEESGNTPLIFAIQENNKDIFKILLEHPLIDVEKTNESGKTALFYAVEAKSTFFLSKLLQKGASTKVTNLHFERRTVLHVAVLSSKYRAIRMLVESGADVNAKSNFNETPLSLACENCKIEIICFLMYHGARADTSTVDCFVCASLNKRPDVEELLFDYVFDNLQRCHFNEIVQILLNSSQAVRVLETITAIDCEFANSPALAFGLPKIDSKVLKLLSSKFPYVLESLTEDEELIRVFKRFFYTWFEGLDTDDFDPNNTMQNLSILINGVVGDFLWDQMSNTCLVSDIIQCGAYDRLLHRDIIEDFCYQLAVRGYKFSAEDFNNVEIIFGLKSPLARFLILLDIQPSLILSYWSRILLDLSYKIGDPLKSDSSIRASESVYNLTRFSALPKVKQICKNLNYMKSLQERVEELPIVPSLTELARNSAREMLVEKCNLRKCSIYYAVIDRLEIQKACKDILVFKQELYP